MTPLRSSAERGIVDYCNAILYSKRYTQKQQHVRHTPPGVHAHIKLKVHHTRSEAFDVYPSWCCGRSRALRV